MTHYNWKLNFFIVLLADGFRAHLSSSGENVCLKTKIHQETIFVEDYINEAYTETEWCSSISNYFRCRVKKHRWKKVRTPKVVNKTEIVPECCDGYEEDPKTNSSCIPVCSVECVHGVCISPEKCACDSGFYGVDCQTPCPLGRWGRNCSEECDCLNDAECGRVNGYCSCRPGWQGYRCEHPCPEGYHGLHCQERCSCKGQPCDHTTGNCLTTTTEMTTSSATEIVSPEKETTSRMNFVEVDHQIKTEQEILTTETISVKSTGKGIPVTESEITEAESKLKTTESVYEPNIVKTESEPTQKTSTSEEIIFQKKIYDLENKSNPSEVLLTTSQVGITREYTTSPTSSTSEGTQRPSDYLTDNLAINETGNNGDDEEISSYSDFTIFRFIPSLTLLTGVSVLIFIIAARWLIINYRTKGQGLGRHEDAVFNVGGRKFFQRDSVFMDNNATENAIYLSDLEFNKVAPILQTFKPLKKDAVKT